MVIVSLLYYFILFDHRECVSSCYWVMKEQALYPSSIVVDSEYGFSLLWVFICFRYCVVDSVPICWCELLSELLPYSLLDYANCSCIAPTKEHSISYSCCANGCRLAGVLFPSRGVVSRILVNYEHVCLSICICRCFMSDQLRVPIRHSGHSLKYEKTDRKS